MGEHTRKRKAVALGDEISVTELEAAGARNRMRAPAGLSTEAPAKSRRISGGGGGDSNKLPVSSCLTRRRSTVAPARDNTSTNNAGRDRTSSPRSNEEPEVCSPTNTSSRLVLDGSKFAEEDKKFHRGKQANCWTVGPGSSNLVMPTEAEVEEFFAEAEKECAKRFMKKYNYDIVNDVPLEGRYEWSPIDTPPLLKKS